MHDDCQPSRHSEDRALHAKRIAVLEAPDTSSNSEPSGLMQKRKHKDQSRMKSVVLIGTSHKYQRPANPAEQEFRNLLEQTCKAYEVRAIAEEMSDGALTQRGASQSLCEQIANAKGIAHRYCDPNNEQRQALGIRQENDIRYEAFRNDWDSDRLEQEIRATYAIRERYWLNQLLDLNCWPVLFVCGANHIKSFCNKLEANGLHADVVARDWPRSGSADRLEHGRMLRPAYLEQKLMPQPLPTKDGGVLRTIDDAHAYIIALPKKAWTTYSLATRLSATPATSQCGSVDPAGSR